MQLIINLKFKFINIFIEILILYNLQYINKNKNIRMIYTNGDLYITYLIFIFS